MFNSEYALAEEVDKIREEFQTLTQTNETVNEIWKKFNDLIRYYPEYHGNEKLKVERFQRMLHGDIRRKGGKTQIKTPCKKCNKAHLGECQANLSGCCKCAALNHMSKDCKKQMVICYNFKQMGHKSNECPNSKVIKAMPLKSMKEEKMEKTGVPNPKHCVYMMATEDDKRVQDVVASTILVSSIPARVRPGRPNVACVENLSKIRWKETLSRSMRKDIKEFIRAPFDIFCESGDNTTEKDMLMIRRNKTNTQKARSPSHVQTSQKVDWFDKLKSDDAFEMSVVACGCNTAREDIRTEEGDEKALLGESFVICPGIKIRTYKIAVPFVILNFSGF
ncbi:zinc finger, CCHC-type, retrotransposon gag domain protein [Tanacetum coccineum]